MKPLPLLASLLLVAGPVFSESPHYVVHEWGTFTSVQGADGVQMDWNPFVAPDLPSFVYDRQKVAAAPKPGGLGIVVAGKTGTGLACIQRMETPVIYFYTDKSLTADVQVDFPQGTITEWFPDKNAAQLSAPVVERSTITKQPSLHWAKLSVVPQEIASSIPPQEAEGSHYYAARETDAAHLYSPGINGKADVEKFLFYRGVATFRTPLTVKLDAADPEVLLLTNNGTDELKNLFILRADGAARFWQSAAALKPGETRKVSLKDNLETSSLEDSLRRALVAEGLYEKEASAMLKTWTSAWFSEKGLRVFYVLPRKFTDGVLPLKIDPKPEEITRVMVARAEVITPAMEKALAAQIERYQAASKADRPGIIADTKALGLGRFASPTLSRVYASKRISAESYAAGFELVQALITPWPRPAPITPLQAAAR